jgi:hypothetical protein
MRLRFRALSSCLMGTVFICAGCSNTTNEEGLDKTKKVDDGAPVFKTYGEKQQYDAEQAAKNRAAAKEKNAKPK